MQILKSLDNEPLKTQDKDEHIILKDICVNALLVQLQDDANEGTSKAGRYALAVKLYSLTEADLSIEELSEIKKRIGKMPHYGPLIVGQCFNMLENK